MNYTLDIYQMLCKLHPNSKIYVIGDQHFCHQNIIQYTRQNFSDINAMNEYIINRHNEIVLKDDIVIFLGDFSFKKDYIREAISKMNGHKYLILGNHDYSDIIKHFPTLGFEYVFKNPVRLKENYLSHEPLINEEKKDLQFQLIVNEFKKCAQGINYHGHLHTNDFIANNYKNVSCEVVNYKPVYIGQTTKVNWKDKKLFIESPYFDEVLEELNVKNNINIDILLSDYLYCHILEKSSAYNNQFFIQGSYGLLKKYNFISKISDLDISLIYNSMKSKNKNSEILRNIVDDAYEFMIKINGTNLSFWKRYPTLKIFELLYTSPHSHFTEGFLDANLIFLDCYKDTDFLSLDGNSLIEKFLPKEFENLKNEFLLPSFNAQFLTLQGDICNLLLQVLFQNSSKEKNDLVLKKLKYICKYYLKNLIYEDFTNTFMRFFLRNLAFFYTMNRYDEINYIKKQEVVKKLMELQKTLPYELQEMINVGIINPNSNFQDFYDEVISTPTPEILKTAQKLIKTLK